MAPTKKAQWDGKEAARDGGGGGMGRAGGSGPVSDHSRAGVPGRCVECARSCGGQELQPEESLMVIEEAGDRKRLVQVRPAPDLDPSSPGGGGGGGREGLRETGPSCRGAAEMLPPPEPTTTTTGGRQPLGRGDCGTSTQEGSVAADGGRPQYPSPRVPRGVARSKFPRLGNTRRMSVRCGNAAISAKPLQTPPSVRDLHS